MLYIVGGSGAVAYGVGVCCYGHCLRFGLLWIGGQTSFDTDLVKDGCDV